MTRTGTPAAGRQQVGPGTHWRDLATAEQLREYDAFGPWIDEVTTRELMPPRFRPWYDELRDAELLLKIPRNAERIALRPGEDLYAAVVAVTSGRLVVLRVPALQPDPRPNLGRDPRPRLLPTPRQAPPTGTTTGTTTDEVERLDVHLEEVVAVRVRTDMLVGRWSALLAGGDTVELRYTAVSDDRIDRLTDLVRAGTGRGGTTDAAAGVTRPASATPPLAIQRSHLTRLAGRSEHGPVACHAEPDRHLYLDERRRPRTTTGLLLVDDLDELVVVDGGPGRGPMSGPNGTVVTTYVRYSAIESATVVHAGRFGRPAELVLALTGHELRLPTVRPLDDALALLRARGVPLYDATDPAPGSRGWRFWRW